jgi:CheY-like chemotaxis protein
MAFKILVVDDNKFPRKMLIKALPEELECDVAEVSRGQEALDAIAADQPDLMFLDLTMPDMDGFTVLARLKEAGNALNVIVISADIQERAVQRVMELGARAFLKKPVSTDDISRVLREIGML